MVSADPPSAGLPDWEAFYRGYKSPGYVQGYEILHKLGGGVFGIVFKARKQSIGKLYAIKFLKLDDHAVRTQVLAELETVKLFAGVDHPNLVSIEDKGMVDGIPFIVMGFAGEETLKHRLEEGPLGEEEALRVFVQVARGVQALHEHSLTHFDLKPANLFLRGEVVRVGDYGLSKLVTESCMSLTFGRGTPYYMAPEMLTRRGDQRSDIYSLGVILFECLTGTVPFTGDSEWEVLEGHRDRPVEFPDSVPVRYRRVLGRMLAKEPAERYASMAHVLQDLRGRDRLAESLVLEYGTGDLAAAAVPSPPPLPRVVAAPRAPAPRVPELHRRSDTERDVLRVSLPARAAARHGLLGRPRRHRRGPWGLLLAAGLGLFMFMVLGSWLFLAGDSRRDGYSAANDMAAPILDPPRLSTQWVGQLLTDGGGVALVRCDGRNLSVEQAGKRMDFGTWVKRELPAKADLLEVVSLPQFRNDLGGRVLAGQGASLATLGEIMERHRAEVTRRMSAAEQNAIAEQGAWAVDGAGASPPLQSDGSRFLVKQDGELIEFGRWFGAEFQNGRVLLGNLDWPKFVPAFVKLAWAGNYEPNDIFQLVLDHQRNSR
ncbi:MAG: serine/threonine-protein kinase [Planctomycetota bacterium]